MYPKVAYDRWDAVSRVEKEVNEVQLYRFKKSTLYTRVIDIIRTYLPVDAGRAIEHLAGGEAPSGEHAGDDLPLAQSLVRVNHEAAGDGEGGRAVRL